MDSDCIQPSASQPCAPQGGRWIYMYIRGLRPLAAGPLSWNPEHRWMVIGGWWLPAGGCWLSISCLWYRRGGLEVALGAVGRLQKVPGRDRGGHERFELTFSNAFGPSDALSLRFPIYLGPQTLSHYACAAKPPGREFRTRHYLRFFIAFVPWAGNLRGGVQGPLLLIPDTCYL